MVNEYDRLRDDYSKINEIFTYSKIDENEYEIILTNGTKKYMKVIEDIEKTKREELVTLL
jgi:hypothetical protein